MDVERDFNGLHSNLYKFITKERDKKIVLKNKKDRH